MSKQTGKLIWAAIIGEDSLEVSVSSKNGLLLLEIIRHDEPVTAWLNNATELRILGESIRLAGMAAGEDHQVRDRLEGNRFGSEVA